MNLNKLTICYQLESGKFYTPDDPFMIYQRLLKLYLEERLDKPIDLPHSRVDLTKPSSFREICRSSSSYCNKLDYSTHFLKFLYQEIPVEFWKFNLLIDGSVSTIRKAIKESSPKVLWVDTPGVKNKIKAVNVRGTVITALSEGRLVLPSYEEIYSQVYEWGNKTKYAFGLITNTYPKEGTI